MLVPIRSIGAFMLLAGLTLSPAVQAACGASTSATKIVVTPLTCEAMDPEDQATICGDFGSTGSTSAVVVASAPPTISVYDDEGVITYTCVDSTGFGVYEATWGPGKIKLTMTSATQGEGQILGDYGANGLPIDLRYRITLK